ncbi:L-threonylcarbamoyladenylate synthase [Thermoflexus hugenholtzii]|uniref:Threonylcarbamoyl-AMP synthase n=1 Tax=Thermoflexus hugenholtzii JAD2 TaxID=877466 RepID=A0A212RCX0_9CHLR|nr:L-threonylcarbamoyladenylate synthase [Thermoflexus hugenholtzii]SNB70125.1 translation factor SUA5 [Thermoflexus hugenholtzii JAD2]
MTRVISIDPERPDPGTIARAAEILRAGGLVAFPTETVYGLGADGLNPKALERLFAAKGRPPTDPVILHIADLETLPRLAREIPPPVWTLAQRFWPGPLTLVLPKQPAVPDLATAGLPTVAVRMPAHPVALALIRAAGTPIAAPSANRFGHVSPTTARHVLEDLESRIDLILDAGPTAIGVESTVLDLTRPVPTILRPGGLPREALEAVLGPVAVFDRAVAGPAPSPGMSPKHYAPRTELVVLLGPKERLRPHLREIARHYVQQGHRVGLLIAEEDRAAVADLPVEVAILGSEADLAGIARRLYPALRELDQRGLDLILAREFGAEGLGLAIRDRLIRAAGGRVIRIEEPS